MLTSIALVPSAPVLVPELASGAAAELTALSAAVRAAAGELPRRWVAVGSGPADDVIGPGAVGTFGGYGADVRVALSPGATAAPVRLPLCALIAGWLRGQVDPAADVEVRVFADALDADTALARGRALRAELDESPEPVGVLVVADGANTLTPAAPGGHDPDSPPRQEVLDDALAAGDLAALAGLLPHPEGPVGRVAYQVLAGLAAPAPIESRELFRDAPYGVGYFVGVWTP